IAWPGLESSEAPALEKPGLPKTSAPATRRPSLQQLLHGDFQLRGLARFDSEIFEHDVAAHIVAVRLDAVGRTRDEPGECHIALRVALGLTRRLIAISAAKRDDLGGQRLIFDRFPYWRARSDNHLEPGNKLGLRLASGVREAQLCRTAWAHAG